MLKLDSKTISITVVFTALIALTTVGFQISIPETQGYFNLGEIVVYMATLLFGPTVGCIAGEVSSALADMCGILRLCSCHTVIKGVERFYSRLSI